MHPKNVVEKCISGAMADVVEHVLGKVVQRNLIKVYFHLPEYFQVCLRGTISHFFPQAFQSNWSDCSMWCDIQGVGGRQQEGFTTAPVGLCSSQWFTQVNPHLCEDSGITFSNLSYTVHCMKINWYFSLIPCPEQKCCFISIQKTFRNSISLHNFIKVVQYIIDWSNIFGFFNCIQGV